MTELSIHELTERITAELNSNGDGWYVTACLSLEQLRSRVAFLELPEGRREDLCEIVRILNEAYNDKTDTDAEMWERIRELMTEQLAPYQAK